MSEYKEVRVLILYARAGNGHFKAAEAVKQKLEKETCENQCANVIAEYQELKL